MVQIVAKLIAAGAVIWLLAVLSLGMKEILAHLGAPVYLALCFGFALGVLVYQVAHKLRYGIWFDVIPTAVRRPIRPNTRQH